MTRKQLPYMASQLQHECWDRHRPKPAPTYRGLTLVMTVLAWLTLLAGAIWCVADNWTQSDWDDGVAALTEAMRSR